MCVFQGIASLMFEFEFNPFFYWSNKEEVISLYALFMARTVSMQIKQ